MVVGAWWTASCAPDEGERMLAGGGGEVDGGGEAADGGSANVDPVEVVDDGGASEPVAATDTADPPAPVLIEPDDEPTESVAPDPEAACVETRSESRLNEAALLLIVDTSGSMEISSLRNVTGSLTDGPSRLEVTVDAIQAAVEQLPSWVHVGLIEYPALSTRDSLCQSGRVQSPLDQLGEIDAPHRTQLRMAVNALEASGGTPTLEAYHHGLSVLEQYTPESLEGGQRLVALLTDGVPGGLNDACPVVADNTGDALAQLAIDALANQGVSTFVLGSPGSEAGRQALSQMAEAGGTGAPGCSSLGPDYCHIDMTEDDDFSAALAAALSQVTRDLISCSYSIPDRSPDGELVDRERINVRVTTGDDAPTELFLNEAADCQEGWFFAGDTVQLCSASCESVQTAQAATLDLLLGCETRVAPPTLR